jgi:glyoxylase-like metal-dependent hydrolase (beta-lactamase superfamily II)
MAGEIDLILITHRHPDHIGGAAALAQLTGAPVRAFGPAPVDGVQIDHPITDGEVIDRHGVTLVALHTPGHASDHLSFYLREAASLFAGDNILGEGTAVIAPPDGNMTEFLGSLERVAALHIDRIYPGHFRPLDGGKDVIERLIHHRMMREAAVLAAVLDGCHSPDAVVAQVYTDTPPALHPIALFSVKAHLEKLRDEGQLVLVDERWSQPGDR